MHGSHVINVCTQLKLNIPICSDNVLYKSHRLFNKKENIMYFYVLVWFFRRQTAQQANNIKPYIQL